MLEFDEGVTLLGGGPWSEADLADARALAPRLVCADGGANGLGEAVPDAIVGDGDSIVEPDVWRRRLGSRFVEMADQDDTDFDKCLRATAAPFFVAVGFLGGRVDHELAVLSAMIADARPIIAIGAEDAVASVRTEISFEAGAGDRVSLFPLREVVVERAGGLVWPATGLTMKPGGRIGTSNEATGGLVSLAFDRPGALVIAERRLFPSLLAAAAGDI